MDARHDVQTLTLPQLRSAGRAGWKEGYLFVEGTVFRIVAIPKPGGAYQVGMRPSDLDDKSPSLRDGWSHMPHHNGRMLTSAPTPAE